MDRNIIQHFQSVDQILYRIVLSVDIKPLSSDRDYFKSLCNAIICQQLSEKAGRTIWQRFESIFLSGTFTPDKVLKISVETMRNSGVSNAKARYIHAIAQAFLDRIVKPEEFVHMTDEEIIQVLVTIKGIGRWTAEMFLIFSLGRLDVFSAGDLGLRKALQKAYGLKSLPNEKWIGRKSKLWSPYKSYAALALWKSLESL